MRKTIKTTISLFFVIICTISVGVFAEDINVYDQAELFTQEEITELQGYIDGVKADYSNKIEIVIATTDNAEGKTAMEYADDFYDYNGFPEDGVLFLIDMDNREIWISKKGEAIRYFTDARINYALDNSYVFMSEEDYYGAANIFVDSTNYILGQGIPSDQYNYDTETGEISKYVEPKSISLMDVLISFGVAAAVGIIVCLCVMGKYQLKLSQYNYPMRDRCRLNLTRQEDIFINEHTTAHKIQTSSSNSSSSGGGGSSTHRSSSGSSHGGGGRKF